MREEWVLGAWLGGALYDMREFEYYKLQRGVLLDRKCQMIDPSTEGLNSGSGKGSREKRFGFKGEL